MLLHLSFAIVFFQGMGDVLAIDPFSGFALNLNCFNEREVTGCNESLVEAYGKTEDAKSDVSVKEADTHMFLFTRDNRDNPEPLHRCGGKLPENSNYKVNRKTIIYISGNSACQCYFAMIRESKDQSLYRGNYNVILTDWCWGSGPDYGASATNSKIVGKQIAFLIRNIKKQTGTSLKKFHLVGISLGAQAAGFAGQSFKPDKIGRITGLDPAMPGFAVDDPEQKLDQDDAEWVDIIHTNAGSCFPNMGDPRIIGHADFYVNGGSVQMSCIPRMVESLLKGDALYGLSCLYPNSCFHAMSMVYFKTSINPCDCLFIGVECESYEDFQSGKCRDCGEDGSKCAVMGMDWGSFPRRKGKHKYYLNTSLSCPYCDNSGIILNGFSKVLQKCASRRHCFSPESEV